jgi:hypothetical protein
MNEIFKKLKWLYRYIFGKNGYVIRVHPRIGYSIVEIFNDKKQEIHCFECPNGKMVDITNKLKLIK